MSTARVARLVAAFRKLDPEERQYVTQQLLIIQATRGRANVLSQQESALFAIINKTLPPEQVARFLKLREKISHADLTSTEREEYIGYLEENRKFDAERIPAVEELATLRGVTLAEMIEKLGLGPLLDRIERGIDES